MQEEQNDEETQSGESKLDLNSSLNNISAEQSDHSEEEDVVDGDESNTSQDSDVERDCRENEEKPSDENIECEHTTSKFKPEEQKLGQELSIIVGSTIFLAMLIYLLLTVLGLTSPARPLVVSKGAAKPFFHGRHRNLIEDNYDGSIKISNNQSMSVILLYSPYSFKSKLFREEYFKTARKMSKLHGKNSPYFTATNCFESSSYCRRKYNLKQYPALMAQNHYLMGSVYNGPLSSLYVTRWLNRLHNPLLRIQSPEELVGLSEKYDVIVILYYTIEFKASKWPSAKNFTKLAFHYLDGDPNTERTIFCTVTDAQLAAQFQLHNEHDVVIVSSQLKLLSTHYKGWTLEKLYESVVFHVKEAEKTNVQFLNIGTKSVNTQLAEKMEQGSVLLYFSPNILFGSENYMMLQKTAKDYFWCPEKDILSVDIPSTDVVENCSVSVKSQFCSTNSTLSFLIADSRVESELAIKLGGFKNEMVISINAQQEITRFIRKNVTKETINCLIRQHHNTADNEFVSESSKIMIQNKSKVKNQHPDSIGEKSMIRISENVSDIFNTEKINVILFSGGVWHSASTSALAPFHMLANFFRQSSALIQFLIIDVSQTHVPYNLNFDQLPKILITSVDSVGVSWAYPEDFMINHTNVARFVLSRPGKMFGRLRWLNSCQGNCRRRARLETRKKRSVVKKKQMRNVASSSSQRLMIGHYNRILRMMG